MKKYIAIIISVLMVQCLFAQLSLNRQVIGSAGSNTVGSGTEISWTAGETVIGTTSSGSITLTQGFQQPDDKSVSIKKPEAGIDLKIYPNPTSHWVIIEANADNPMQLNYNVFTLNGQKVALPNNILQVHGHTQKQIDFSGLSQSTYILVITKANGQKVATIKIIKTY